MKELMDMKRLRDLLITFWIVVDDVARVLHSRRHVDAV